jgi:hypothetical protein
MSAVIVAAVFLLCGPAAAQDAFYRWEFGPVIGLEGEITEVVTYGARATFNVNRWLGTELQFSRASNPNSVNPSCCGGSRWQGLLHAKLTYRPSGSWSRINVFAIAGPGFSSISNGDFHPQHNLVPSIDRRFAVNAGGGIAVSVTRHLDARFDASVFSTRYPQRNRARIIERYYWDASPDFKAALMVRF